MGEKRQETELEQKKPKEGCSKALESKGNQSKAFKRKNEEYLWMQEQVFGPSFCLTRADDEVPPGKALALPLRVEAKRREDHEVLAALDALAREDRRKRKKHSPSSRLGEDFEHDNYESRNDPVQQRFYHVLARPALFERALRKRVGQERCGRCRRWVYRCKCTGAAAEAMRARERVILDEIDDAAAQAESAAIANGTAIRTKNPKTYGPLYFSDLPDEGSHEFTVLLVGLFARWNSEDWRASWRLPDEVWTDLEDEYDAKFKD
jgi:hypothetical protein